MMINVLYFLFKLSFTLSFPVSYDINGLEVNGTRQSSILTAYPLNKRQNFNSGDRISGGVILGSTLCVIFLIVYFKIYLSNPNNEGTILVFRNMRPIIDVELPTIMKNTISRQNLKRYPVLTFEEYVESISPKHPQEIHFKDDSKSSYNTKILLKQECLICFEEFDNKDKIRAIPCCHIFHRHCIDPWLLEQSGVCPACRLNLRINPTDKVDC
ncbi:hypothetical protein BB559_002321 [Furculomyces boomerangus]|uniref:RING-type E3 ubiquitin transferase n=2 Tax=Harpellales TaxID=61421 RepID=A0A2T9YWD5_9FUNG|nr:hypothetical protein BB559_002321 [Furculomyces boomerangus]PWA03642.1 hypothetical protein BB558_000161 [Smittium angustum]